MIIVNIIAAGSINVISIDGRTPKKWLQQMHKMNPQMFLILSNRVLCIVSRHFKRQVYTVRIRLIELIILINC